MQQLGLLVLLGLANEHQHESALLNDGGPGGRHHQGENAIVPHSNSTMSNIQYSV